MSNAQQMLGSQRVALSGTGPVFGWLIDLNRKCVFIWDHDVLRRVADTPGLVGNYIGRKLLQLLPGSGVPMADILAMRYFYRDTSGEWGELTRHPSDGHVTGFAHGMPAQFSDDAVLLATLEDVIGMF